MMHWSPWSHALVDHDALVTMFTSGSRKIPVFYDSLVHMHLYFVDHDALVVFYDSLLVDHDALVTMFTCTCRP